jgi:sodium/bile acid cotransporter 7
MPDSPSAADREKWQRIEKLYQRSRGHFPTVPELTAPELVALRASRPVLLVDVRNQDELAVSRIPGAITPQELEERWSEALATPVVTYCTIGHRSGLYAQMLRDRGVDAYNLAGSILAWTHNGGELVNAGGPTRRVHVSGPKWSLEADGYEPVW